PRHHPRLPPGLRSTRGRRLRLGSLRPLRRGSDPRRWRLMFRLAHVSDPHFRSFAGARPRDFFSKRLLGTLNIALFRRRKHRMELLADLGRELRARPADHLALTGDLGNVSLEGEWQT